MHKVTALSIVLSMFATAHAASTPRRPTRSKACPTKLATEVFDGLRGTGGPQDHVHTARIVEQGRTKFLVIVAGWNELSPLVARIKISAKVVEALKAGDLESLDGTLVTDADAKLGFRIDGSDFQRKARLGLSGEYRGVGFKVSGCSSYREGQAMDF